MWDELPQPLFITLRIYRYGPQPLGFYRYGPQPLGFTAMDCSPSDLPLCEFAADWVITNNQQLTNQTPNTEKNKQKMDEVSNSKVWQVSGSGKNHQQSTIDQHVEPSPHPPQSLIKSTIDQHHAASPQGSQHSSPHAVPRNMSPLCKSPAAEEPINRLLKVVKSIPPKALSSSLKEIGAIVTMTDRMAGSDQVPGGRAYIGPDLCQELGYQLRRKNSSTPTEGGSKKKMRHDIDALALDDLSSTFSPDDLLEWLNDPESSMETNKPRIEHTAQLLAEIDKINGKLVETMLEVVTDSTNDAATVGPASGTIVKCSFVGVSFESFFKQQNVSSELMPSLFLRFLVPVEYPNSSPAVVDILPDASRGEPKDLKEKIKMMFGSSICKLSHLMSLGEMAEAWDASARAVLTEFTVTMGGTNFSARSGNLRSTDT